jgi:phosphorylcholine metabolism protein LicD
MEPRKRKIPSEKDLDYYMGKKDYGRVPNYLKRAKSANQRNLNEKVRVQNVNERYRNKMRKVLDNNELE